MDHNSFGKIAMEARKNAGLTLRKAALLLGPSSDKPLSPSYLSKIELGRCQPPSGLLLVRMARLYGVPVDTLLAGATNREGEVIASEVHERPELVQLYKLAAGQDREQILALIKELVGRLPEQDRRLWEARFRTEFPRLVNQERGLFGAHCGVRKWSRIGIRSRAHRILAQHGLTTQTYEPPTPIESIVEDTPDVRLHPSDSEEMNLMRDGSPLVLGVTKWDLDGVTRVIEINERLYMSNAPTDRHRTNYTLAHELWHAIEHLPLVGADNSKKLYRASAASAVSAWTGSRIKSRKFQTDEDWQEWQAQVFAAEILMPSWDVLARFEMLNEVSKRAIRTRSIRQKSLNLVDLRDINGKTLNEVYQVSRQSMAIRLLELGLINDRANTLARKGGALSS